MKQFTVIRVSGDGSCLFTAISKLLQIRHKLRISPRKLRQLAVSTALHLLSKNDSEAIIASKDPAYDAYNNKANAYEEDMTKWSTYGASLELLALSRALRVCIAVYASYNNKIKLVARYGRNNKHTLCLWLTNPGNEDAHYQGLVPVY